MGTATTQVLDRRLDAIRAELEGHRRLGSTPPPSRQDDLEHVLGEVCDAMEQIADELGDTCHELLALIAKAKQLARRLALLQNRNGDHSIRVEP